MNKSQLERVLGRIRAARDASNWQGKFTAEIRQATVVHRMEEIASPLDEAIHLVQLELDKRNMSRHHKRAVLKQRLPYKDD